MSEAPWFNRTRRCAADWPAPLWNAYSLPSFPIYPSTVDLALSLFLSSGIFHDLPCLSLAPSLRFFVSLSRFSRLSRVLFALCAGSDGARRARERFSLHDTAQRPPTTLHTTERGRERDCTNTVSPCIIIQWRPESAEAAALAVREDVTRVSVLSLSLSLSGSTLARHHHHHRRTRSAGNQCSWPPTRSHGAPDDAEREKAPLPLHSTPRLFRAVKIIWGLCVKRYRGVLVKNLQNFN